MIEDPPLLTVRRSFPRPSPAQVAILGEAPTSFLVDCMDGQGALDYRLKPLDPGHRMAGVAMPCRCRPADNLAAFAALGVMQAGDVPMIATESHRGCAVIGDRILGMMRNKGAAGCVTDGLIRDIDGILAVGLPVFSAGVSPNSPVRMGPGTVGLPVQLGGVLVSAGDVVVGDKDGVVVVPYAEIDRVIARLAEIRVIEVELDAKVAAGLDTLPSITALLASSKVRWVD